MLFLREGLTARDVFGAVLIGSSVVYFAIADHREATAQAQADGGDVCASWRPRAAGLRDSPRSGVIRSLNAGPGAISGG